MYVDKRDAAEKIASNFEDKERATMAREVINEEDEPLQIFKCIRISFGTDNIHY